MSFHISLALPVPLWLLPLNCQNREREGNDMNLFPQFRNEKGMNRNSLLLPFSILISFNFPSWFDWRHPFREIVHNRNWFCLTSQEMAWSPHRCKVFKKENLLWGPSFSADNALDSCFLCSCRRSRWRGQRRCCRWRGIRSRRLWILLTWFLWQWLRQLLTDFVFLRLLFAFFYLRLLFASAAAQAPVL